MKCPCEDCLCIPICRNKMYFELFNDCSLIHKYIETYDNYRLQTTQKILSPQWWSVSGNDNTITLRVVKYEMSM